MKLESQILFDGHEKIQTIENFCGRANIEQIKTFRTTKIESPKLGYHRIFEKEKVVKYYD
jgi:hypothetical protein